MRITGIPFRVELKPREGILLRPRIFVAVLLLRLVFYLLRVEATEIHVGEAAR